MIRSEKNEETENKKKKTKDEEEVVYPCVVPPRRYFQKSQVMFLAHLSFIFITVKNVSSGSKKRYLSVMVWSVVSNMIKETTKITKKQKNNQTNRYSTAKFKSGIKISNCICSFDTEYWIFGCSYSSNSSNIKC